MFRYARYLSACALLAVLPTAGPVRAEAPALQVIQAGDADLSCEALAGQINGLSADQAKAAKRAASGRKLLGFASTALQVAGPILSSGMGKAGGDGGMGAMMAQQAMGQMQAQAMQQQMGMAALGGLGGMAAGYGAGSPETAEGSIESQRLARLNHLHVQKGC